VTTVCNRRDADVTGTAGHRARKLVLHEFAKADAVSTEPHGFKETIGSRLEAGQAVEHVVRPARFPVFAVVDDVDAGIDLASHHINGRPLERAPVAPFRRRPSGL
jgi:hypothetical protein